MRTLEEARRCLDAELEAVDAENPRRDNPVAAVRAVADVARRFRPEAPTSWDAFRHVAIKAVRPYFDARQVSPAKAAVWAVVDPHFGKVERESASFQGSSTRNSGHAWAAQVRDALTGSGR